MCSAGLTDEDIALAIQQASLSPPQPPGTVQHVHPRAIVQPQTSYVSWRRLLFGGVVLGGVVWMVVRLVKVSLTLLFICPPLLTGSLFIVLLS